MSRYFMYGTSLQESEQMMMSVPNFLPRTKGMFIMGQKTIDEKEEFKRCIYCSEYSKGGCQTAHCPYLLDRADFGQIGYADFIKDSFWDSDDFFFKKRLRGLFRSFTGEWFMSSYHKDRYLCLAQGSALFQSTKKQNLALLYLLTANEQLWDRAKDHIYPNKIALSEISLTGINTTCYALFQAAKTIAGGKLYIEENELADKNLIGEIAFKTIIQSFLIARYGDEIMTVKQ
ncbi:hypothetical protein [Oscillibacter sp.]|jgi:hypothetical protein|uniref:hypothetical protein n=1 Tax=Oscillibacter sp. TaxID=1945593 RepID=UPI00289A809E|nr:hypothetical protein [Oscillibacter sp.]